MGNQYVSKLSRKLNQPADSLGRAEGAFSTPLRVFALTLALAFLIEMGIMLVLSRCPAAGRHSLVMAVLDALGLTAVMAPALWVLVVRPLRSLFEQRGRLLARVFEVQEQERARLARDLHDELGQQLTAALLGLRSIDQAADVAQARERAKYVHPIAAASLDAVRRLARGLAPAMLVDLGLRAAVESLCESMSSASGLKIVLDLRLPERRLRPPVEIAVYRVLQEALTNVVRHARATRADVRLVAEGNELRLEISDDGAGLPEHAGPAGRAGFGLQGMRERIALLGGTFRVASAAGAGTQIWARIPRIMPEDEPYARTDR